MAEKMLVFLFIEIISFPCEETLQLGSLQTYLNERIWRNAATILNLT